MEKIALWLKRRGLSQADLSRATGIRESRLTQLGHANGKLRLPEALRIARVLGVSLDYLADPELTEPPERFSADELSVLRMVRTVGMDEALRRLMRVPGQHDVALIEQPGTHAEPEKSQRRGAG